MKKMATFAPALEATFINKFWKKV